MIYFIQNTVSKAIKIGYSKNPERRHKSLQTATPDPLVILGKIHGGLEHENAYHKQFAKYALTGEWFKGEIFSEVVRVIAKYPMDKPAPTNVFVFGDRHFRYKGEVERALDELHAKNPIAWVVTADVLELDRWAWAWADKNGAQVYRYYTEWSRYGRGAPAKVGKRLLGAQFDTKTFLAFQEGEGKSDTTRLVKQARKKKFEVVVKSVAVPARAPMPGLFPDLMVMTLRPRVVVGSLIPPVPQLGLKQDSVPPSPTG